jgi:uncharacterized protein HemX
MTTTFFCTVRRSVLMAAVVGLAAISGVSGAQAQERRSPAIFGVVNTDRILQDSLAAKGVRLEREKFAQSYQTQIKDEEAKLRAEDQELSSRRKSPSSRASPPLPHTTSSCSLTRAWTSPSRFSSALTSASRP